MAMHVQPSKFAVSHGEANPGRQATPSSLSFGLEYFCVTCVVFSCLYRMF